MPKQIKLTAKMPYGKTEEDFVLEIHDDGRMQLWGDQGPAMNVAPMICGREGYAFIKNYSENEGILDILINNNIVEDTGETIPAGHTHMHKVKILV